MEGTGCGKEDSVYVPVTAQHTLRNIQVYSGQWCWSYRISLAADTFIYSGSCSIGSAVIKLYIFKLKVPLESFHKS